MDMVSIRIESRHPILNRLGGQLTFMARQGQNLVTP